MPTMTGLLSLLATGVLVALGVWLLGGVLLRVGGILLVAGGLLSTAATGSPAAALLTVLGTRLAMRAVALRASSLLQLAAGAARIP
jgi:hypothetical protein